MPAKKKRGKASKLARMSDEERARYLQHRAELELEAKRRKQQLIAVFTKNKLKREEAFSRLNTAKINEQWRFILRKIKCKELYTNVEHLWKNFDRTIKAKDAVIHKLYDELKVTDVDHRRLQDAHMTIIDKLIGIHGQRLKFLHGSYLHSLREFEYESEVVLNEIKKDLEADNVHLESVIFAQTETLENKLLETKTRNAVNTHNVVYSKEESISKLVCQVGRKTEELWIQLNSIIFEYESATESKRKQYEYLKEQDDVIRAEAAQFPKLQTQLQDAVETLRNEVDLLSGEREENIALLKEQVDTLNKRVWKLRQEIKLTQTTDRIQLKRLSVISCAILKDLERIVDKGSMLNLLTKVCSNFELPTIATKKYAIHRTQSAEESAVKCAAHPYNEMEKFWQRYNYVKADNILMRKEHSQLSLENKTLRRTLRTYLITVARIPAPRPHTAI